MNLSDRDIRILKALRYGIVTLEDMVDEVFSTTDIKLAHRTFQQVVSRKINIADERFALLNQALVFGIVEVCHQYSGDRGQLEKEVIRVGHMLGAHLGRSFRQKLPALSKKVSGFTGSYGQKVDTVFQSVFDEYKQQKLRKKQVALCRKVLKRLVEAKLIREVVALQQRKENRYFHLTKNLGKPLLQEMLADEGDFGYVAAHHYHAMHAKHDAMVTETIKSLLSFADQHDYQVQTMLSEAEQKSIALDRRLSRKQVRKRKKIFFTDLFVQINFSDHVEQATHINLEIDNGTQSVRNIFGKVNSRLPTVLICSTPDRANFLLKQLLAYQCPSHVFLTTISRFNEGGLLKSDFLVLGRGKEVRMVQGILR